MGAPLDRPAVDNGLEFKRVAGGLLIQKRFDSKIISPLSVDVVSLRKPTEDEVRAAIFNWTVASFTRSNAVVIGKSDKVHGIGSGQRSRIDSAENAIRYSRRGYGPKGCVMASDAFMPFPDVVELAAQNGITAVIYPLGSVKDQEVIDKANELGLAMIVTRKPGEADCERCFLHR
jgi:phosphoribosylaminoimidazolecarboxamide formyltransferase/IMP cyclohydrolase